MSGNIPCLPEWYIERAGSIESLHVLLFWGSNYTERSISVTILINNHLTPPNKEDYSATAIFNSKPVYMELLHSLNGFINLNIIYNVIIKPFNI